MATVTLSELRTRARQRADMEASGFVQDDELNTYINASYAELYDLLVSKYGEDYFVASPFAISATQGVDTYSLPADFYKLLGVDLQLGTSNWRSLKRFEFIDRNVSQVWNLYTPDSIRYRLFGNSIKLTPAPQTAQSLQVWYIPLPEMLVTDNDSFSGVNGYEEYVVIDAAIKMLTKEESDTTQLLIEKQAMKLRIEQMAEARDVGQPATVQDTSELYSWKIIS